MKLPVTRLIADIPVPAPAGGPDVGDFKSVVARAMIVILIASVVLLGIMLAFHAMQHMFGGEEGAVKAKAGIRRVILGFAGVVLATPLGAVLYWVFATAISKALAGG